MSALAGHFLAAGNILASAVAVRLILVSRMVAGSVPMPVMISTGPKDRAGKHDLCVARAVTREQRDYETQSNGHPGRLAVHHRPHWGAEPDWGAAGGALDGEGAVGGGGGEGRAGAASLGCDSLDLRPRVPAGAAPTGGAAIEGGAAAGAGESGRTTCAQPGLVRQSCATAQIGISRIRADLDVWQ